MKIREVHFQGIRGFDAPLRRVRFYDEETNLVRPLSVIVGSNGSGKTTVLQLIEALLTKAIGRQEGGSIVSELSMEGFAALNVEFGATAPEGLHAGLWSVYGRLEQAPNSHLALPNQISSLRFKTFDGPENTETEQVRLETGPRNILRRWVGSMERGVKELFDGLLFLPHNRWIEHVQRGPIEPPPSKKAWLFHFHPDSGWSGSLSQLWLWQNYLDLEAGREGRNNLLSFVEPIEHILGRGRKVTIKEGLVRIAEPKGRSVALHELPSGEQQILTLFGEIIRQLRPGGVLIIDEVEISLHPALQRVVIAHLRTLAREYDLQVLVTTHSMEIVKSVAPHEIVNLDDMAHSERQSGA